MSVYCSVCLWKHGRMFVCPQRQVTSVNRALLICTPHNRTHLVTSGTPSGVQVLGTSYPLNLFSLVYARPGNELAGMHGAFAAYAQSDSFGTQCCPLLLLGAPRELFSFFFPPLLTLTGEE